MAAEALLVQRITNVPTEAAFTNHQAKLRVNISSRCIEVVTKSEKPEKLKIRVEIGEKN